MPGGKGGDSQMAARTDGTGAHRDHRSSGRSRRWWAVTVLASAVGATSIMVPSLVSSGTPRDSRAATSPATTNGPGGAGDAALPGASVATEFQTVRIAATDPANERFGVTPIACPTCASGSRMQYVGQGHALVVHVRNVRAAGRRTLTIVYETSGVRPLDLSVNGGTTISLRLPGKDSWTTPAEISLLVELPAGQTVIRLFHASLPAPDLDQIVIS